MARYAATYTTAQTDTVLISVASGQGFRITGIDIGVDRSVTVALVACAIEFDDTADVYVGGHAGIAPGSGWSRACGYGEDGIADGADGQDVIVTCDAATGGEIRVAVNGYFITY